MWQEFALIAGPIFWALAHIGIDRMHVRRRRYLDAWQAELTAAQAQLMATRAEVHECIAIVKARTIVCKEFAALWSYGAHEEAVAVLNAADGINVVEGGKG